MSISVGTLTIDLTASTASFTSEMSKASQLAAKTANDIKRSLEKVAAVGLAMGAAIATGTAAMVEGALDAADKMGKLAQSTGTTAETLSVLSYAGKLAGVETEQLGKGLEKLSQSAFKAQNGNQGLQNIFARLGTSAVDSNGHLKDSGVLMEQLAVKFAGMGDGAGKTALAMALFGKAGAGLIPFLNLYGAKQAEINEQAHRFGLELSTSTVQLAAQAKEKLDGLKSVATGFGFALLSSTLPALDKLASQLIKIAEDANIPDLGKAFGEKVVTAVTALGDAMMFAEKHAHALKIAFEALAGLKLATIAIPVISDLTSGGGIDKATSGIGRLILQSAGISSKVIPALVEFGSAAKYNASFIALMASEEGIAAAVSYAWTSGLAAANAALSTMAGLLGVTTAGLAIFGVALVNEKTAAEKLAGVAVTWGDMWHAAMKNVQDDARVLLDILKGDLPKAVMDLSGFKSLRTRAAEEAKARPVDKSETLPPPRPKLPPPNTAGLGPKQKDPYAEEIRKLNEGIAAQKAYLAVIDGTPEKIAEVAAAEKAQGIILELNNRLLGEGKPALNALQQATISQKVATEESTKALVEYGRELVGQQHSTELSIQQTRAMAAANLEGDAAVRAASIDNAILALRFNRVTGAVAAMTPELAKLREELTAKTSIDLLAGANKETDALRDQLAARKLLTEQTLGPINAQREAELDNKLVKINENIADPTLSADAVDGLKRQRDALVELTKAEWAANDAEAARSLFSPGDEYQRSTDSLNHAIEALKELQGGTLTYTQQLGIAAKQQDEFNKATDGTIDLLLKEGSLGDGVTAFFLKMQEGAKTAAATIFDVMNETFNKLSDNLTQLITAPNRFARKDAINAFATSFENIGKNLLDSQIKVQLQSGLGALGKVFGVDLSSATGKADGSTSSNALWVRWASANGSPATSLGGGSGAFSAAASAGGNELDDLLGGPPSPQPTFPSVRSGASQAASVLGSVTQGQPGPLGAAGGLLSTFGKLFGLRQPANRSGGVLGGETLGLPTSGFSTLNELAKQEATGGNELADLIGQNPAPSISPVLQSIPQLLRRTPESETGLTAGEDAASVIPQAPDVQPKPYTLIARPQPSALSGILQTILGLGGKLLGGIGGGGATGGGSSSSDAAGSTTDAGISDMTGDLSSPSLSPALRSIPTLLRGNSEADTGLTAGEDTAASSIPVAPDVQPKKYTLITRPQPSALSGILSTVLGLGTKILGGIGGGSGAGADAAGSAASSVTDAAASSESDISDFSDFMMAGGGHVSGPGTGTSDSIPARLSHGEFVTKAAQTAKYLPLLHRINNDTLPRFSAGGILEFSRGGMAVPRFASGGLVGSVKIPHFSLGGIVGYDDGGFVSPSAAYSPGERSWSTMSNASNRISATSNTSSSKSSVVGDTHNHYIDARGSNDPAQVTAHLDRYMQKAGPQIAAMALHAVKDQQLRRAPSAR